MSTTNPKSIRGIHAISTVKGYNRSWAKLNS
jgi:hypothetical protein